MADPAHDLAHLAVKDEADPNSWWVILVAGVGCGILVISVYLTSAFYYQAASGYQDEVVVDAQNQALAELRARQEDQLQQRGERTTEDDRRVRTVPIAEAMAEVAKEN